jgi:cold shock CspA family protein
MQVPLEIAFHNLQSSQTLEREIRKRTEKLESRYGRLTACRVRIEVPHRSHRTGDLIDVRIELSVPGRELVVTNGARHARERYSAPGPLTVIREAFKAAERQLKDFKRQIGGEVKRHDTMFLGRVTQLNPDEDHGFLLSTDGSQLYFHRNSVLSGDFDQLAVGDAVHYVETVGDTGPIASKVRPANPSG